MAGGAVATSGSYEIYFDPDRTLHHIVSSRTGRSPDVSSSVTVRAPSSMAADALATAVFVMEPAKGVRFIESLPRCECLVIDKHGRTLKSKGWKSAASARREKAGNDARINSD
jgi:thiamine biosynthesis lipoprotein